MTDETDWPPGLLIREIFSDGGIRYLREEWDLTVPGCPMIAIDHGKWGSGESVINRNVTRVTRMIPFP